MSAFDKFVAAVVAVGLGAFPLWFALLVAEARDLRRRTRAAAAEADRR